MHEMIVQHLRSQLPRVRIVLVKPSTAVVDVHLDDLLFLDGFHDEIPLKTDYAGCMIVIDLPTKEHLEGAFREWRRVQFP